ncbi:hypothetical protein COW36_24550 [bacterium (Candidatus Blackallbacteria) CG17_big_fil_post_rev_8_21_14_2_50_48_46]|uniref:Uncharacterized protein n=1 Tax=bacterium (Candidatus Blackallbacteria) CG17_big_fil_post_rev_8_21_14_2_50_48_46 TaxID=2014261 RepID=A0A2M7FX63_9BACT|nr:MAG: hypothetical protein COW64_19490 [bacterium (Candidatus Blackallbacteria) CG18_big_fil_WC_8_21_14_2_50_49_26]PIW13840.1 MAG: hypothetical protein COW36_24550 [bacterium (Candidatus Blackallbacteria) CG17_big_fil_post_rev_8_21_14_2_50_48_46]PIW45066.1 MAG: hypothetical protein COW20_22180 [bacterium (Candidatus Blackallbacteria) CG13_big_fil_rev_8_21_14_2_50_49_14]
MKVNQIKKLSKPLLVGLIGSTLLLATGCGKRTPLVSDVASSEPAAGVPGVDPNLGSGIGAPAPYPGDSNSDGYSDLPQQPTDIPEPLPAPTTPVQPGAPITMRAVANTTAFALPQFSNLFRINGVYVYIHLTWQPVTNAAEYWLYKGRIPEFNEARRETAYAIVPAGFARAGFKDGLEAPNLNGGSLLDKLQRGFNMITNRPGVQYDYKVIAVDANGIPMSESPMVQSVPLAPISSPKLDPAADTNTRNPLFTWRDGQEGTKPDGYYTMVFPSVQFTNGTLPPTSIAYWSVFRPAGTNVVRYGDDSSNLTSYSGTLPFDITFTLGAGKNYSWTVVGVKTDTGDMKTASAISRSWSGFGNFQIAANAAPPVVTANSVRRRQQQGGVSSFAAPRYGQAPVGQTTYGQGYPQQTGYPQQYPQQQAPRAPQPQIPTNAPRF